MTSAPFSTSGRPATPSPLRSGTSRPPRRTPCWWTSAPDTLRVTVLADGQTVFATSFPSGSEAFTAALAADQGCPLPAAEALKRDGPLPITPTGTPQLQRSVETWLQELERTLLEWREDHPDLAAAAGTRTAFLAGGGARPACVRRSPAGVPARSPTGRSLAIRPRFPRTRPPPGAACSSRWGSDRAGPFAAPRAAPVVRAQKRLWRALLSANLGVSPDSSPSPSWS